MAVDYDKVLIRRGKLVYKGRVLGPVDKVYAYPGEQVHLGNTADVVVCTTPERIDLVFAAGEKVVGCEVKRWDDLIRSHQSRRLARQLATLKALVDIPCLVIRESWPDFTPLRVWQEHNRPDLFWSDWANMQTQGVYIFLAPLEPYIGLVWEWRKALATPGTRVLAGTDRRVPRERRPGWLLRRIPTIGADRSTRLIKAFESTAGVFQAAELGMVAPLLGPAVERKILAALEE